MPDLAKIILKNHKIDAVKRFHPWIFSGAIKEMAGEVKEGAIVEVYSDRGEYLATGLYNPIPTSRSDCRLSENYLR